MTAPWSGNGVGRTRCSHDRHAAAPTHDGHSRLPWTLIERESFYGWRYIDSADGDTVNPAGSSMLFDDPRSKADAELIVRAVNAHHELLSALKALRTLIVSHPQGWTYANASPKTLPAVDAAIKKAEATHDR